MNPYLMSLLSHFDKSVSLKSFLHAEEYERMTHFLPSLIKEKVMELDLYVRKLGVTVLHPLHPAYPRAFLELNPPPLSLFCLGDLAWLDERPRLAIVGSREPSIFTKKWMAKALPEILNESEAILVSGAAVGIDQMAHSASIEKGMPTLAFLPSGLEQIYPSSFRPLISKVQSAGGCLITEYHPKMNVRRHHFVRRNHLIAAFADLVFIAEAAEKSGSAMTGRISSDLGRTLSVLPHHPFFKVNCGGLRLIREGAFLINDVKDLTILLEFEYQRRKATSVENSIRQL